MGKIKKYKLNLGDKTLYLTEESEIKYTVNFLQKELLGSHYFIKDDTPSKGTCLPHTEFRASTFNPFLGHEEKSYYQNYTQSTKWLIELIKKFGEQI